MSQARAGKLGDDSADLGDGDFPIRFEVSARVGPRLFGDERDECREDREKSAGRHGLWRVRQWRQTDHQAKAVRGMQRAELLLGCPAFGFG